MCFALVLLVISCAKEELPMNHMNHSPIANAGNDTIITLPANTINLDGRRSVDPDNGITTYTWTKIEGSSSFSIANASGIQTQVSNLTEGVYLFELKVTDEGGLVARDTMQVTVNQSVSSQQVDIYVAGQQGGVAQYWKNGSGINLPNGTIANSIYIYGNDMYMAGQEYLGGGIHQIAKYWKNGVAINLTDGISYAGANDIYVSNNDTYVAGWESLGNAYAKYWKNGVAVNLPNGGIATSIYVSDNDVYVAGNDTGQLIAKYWKNGNAVNLPNGSGYSSANDIYVSGNDVYVAGVVGGIIDYGDGYWDYGPPSAVYWKNGIAVPLPNGTDAFSIYVAGNDVYVAGREYRYVAGDLEIRAKYWKNGIAINLPNGTQAKSIYVSGKDVYVAGDNNGKAKYWKNGVEVSLNNEASHSSWANSIIVVPR